MNLWQRLHFLVRAWRYRIRGEEFGISYLLGRDLANKTAVDIGANWGIYSYWMHGQVGTGGRVVAFEPQPELATHLHDLRNCFGLRQLEIAPLGLSSEPGELTLRRPRNHWGAASFEQNRNNRDDIDVIVTKVTTLDSFFSRHPARPISFIKCDVEGHELQVFRGARQILSEDRPDLLFECASRDLPDCPVFHYLQSLGYEGFCFSPGGLAPVSDYRTLRPKLHKRARRDFVFVPRERAYQVTRRAAA